MKKKWNGKEKTFILDDDILFVLVLTVFSEHIPLERLNIDLVRSYLHTIFMHFLPYMKEKRGEEENPLVEEASKQEHKRIEEDIKKLGEQKWYLKSKIIYVLCFITPPIGYLYVFLLRKNDSRCKANVLNDRDNYDGIMVFGSFFRLMLAITVVVVACLVFIVKFIK